ncbi:hypothetical protein [Halohasta salina]|uniref:hypothetical protein n=1 Tax=Halohasta salina TaxID=2961621 RepID=UPI0020A4F00A|nr:hypothetical protein [Halohasta salina]
MTAVFDALRTGPQTEIDIALLDPDERMVVRRIRIDGSVGSTPNVPVGRFTGVFYVVGDERRAAERFVEENRDALSDLDFSSRNPISTSVDRDLYDWILHALGERELEVHETVVIERRDDVIWCLGRRTFEETPMRRYSVGGSGSAKIEDVDLAELYDSFDGPLTESTLAAEPSVSGDTRVVLDAFRQSPAFDCRPTTVDGELAIEPVDAGSDRSGT